MKIRSNSLSTAIIVAALCFSTPWALTESVLAESVLTAPKQPPKPPTGSNAIMQPELARCMPGFNRVNVVKSPLGSVTSFECRTPVIHCPHHPTASQVSLVGDADANSNQNPDIAALTLSYSCTYYTPEG
jgi:hypothetical protein